ncbi:IQ domain-containing protein K [Orussus abietinus]|uniref:IQ domain-containing protein K n=1 Tax=Orussus abietinus TaxID=222816 RepID=UPI0006261F3C|nr:IQ domain-containing protein K [Orussus abietinus]
MCCNMDSGIKNDEESKAKTPSLWEDILRESEEERTLFEEMQRERVELLPERPHQEGCAEYLKREIFPILLPAMEGMLIEANRWNALRIQKCRFSGLDYLAEVLWNKNPRRSRVKWLDVFEIPTFKLQLRLNPRPIFPKSWLWTKERAAVELQRWVRGWLVRKQEDVQEMRQFWMAIAEDSERFAEIERHKKEEDKSDPCRHYKRLLDVQKRTTLT